MPRIIAFSLLGLVSVLGAQGKEDGRPFWVSTPPPAASPINAAQAALIQGDTRSAVRSLQSLMDDRSGQRLDYAFIERPQKDPNKSVDRFVGARASAVRLLLSMGRKGFELYEEMFGARAQVELLKALATNSQTELITVARRFEPSRAGRHALLALVDRALLRGQPAEARLLLARLSRLHTSAFAIPAVRARLIEAVSKDISRGGPPASEHEILAGVPPQLVPPRDAWPMMGGNAARNGVADAVHFHPIHYTKSFTIQERHWDRPNKPTRDWRVRRVQQPKWSEQWDEYNPLHPVIARGSLIVNDGPQISSVNLFTGETQWVVPSRTDVLPRGRTNLATLLTPVVDDGVVYAALEVRVAHDSQELQGVPITYYIPERRLVAIDLDTGAVLWSHDEKWAASTPETKDMGRLTVSGPPLVRGERIYVPAARSTGTFENWIVALDRRSGKLIYATSVSDGQQELNLFGRQLQEAFSTPIAERDGVLYYGTNMGIVAAIDALLGTPLWATAYPIVTIPSTFYWFEAPRRASRLDNGPPVIVGDTAVFSPSDGEHVLAVDTKTGRKKWHWHWRSLRSLRVRTVVGADKERVYLSGPGTAMALWLIDDESRQARQGKLAWHTELRGTAELAVGRAPELIGRGVLAKNGLWLPGERYIYQIEEKTGRVRAAHSRDEQSRTPLHLVSGAGVLVTSGRDFVSARFSMDEVMERAKSKSDRAPEDPDAQLQAADVFLAAGAVADAVARYRLAERKAVAAGAAGKADRARHGLHRALLQRATGLLRSAPDRAPADFEAAFRAAPDETTALRARLYLDAVLDAREDPTHNEWRLRNLRALVRDFGGSTMDGGRRSVRGDAMRRITDLLLAMDKPKLALEVLHELLEFDTKGEDGRWAERRLRMLLLERGRGVYEVYENRAARLFRTALESDDLLAVEQGLRLYSNAVAAVPAMLRLAERRLARKEPSEAARVLQRFLAEHGGSNDAPRALALMVSALHESGSHGLAYAALLRLKNRHPNAPVKRADGASVSARAFATEWLKRAPYPKLARSAERNDLQSNLTLQFAVSFAEEEQYVDIPRLVGQRPDVLRDTVLLRIGRDIVVLDAKTGAESYRLKLGLGEPKGPLVLSGNRLHAITDRSIHVFDLERRIALPRVRVPHFGQARRLFAHRGQVFLSYRESDIRGRPGIAAINPTDGSILWSVLFRVGRSDPRTADYKAVPHDDRILLFATHPVSVTAIDATSGAIANQIEIPDVDPGANLVRHHVLGDGRALLGLGTAKRFDRWQFKHSYELLLVDPAAPAESATLWRYKPRQSKHSKDSRMLYAVELMGSYAVAVDRNRFAAVVDMGSGNEVAFKQLQLGAPGERTELSQVRGRDDSVLYVQTGSRFANGRPNRDRPSRLAAFSLPDLQRNYMVDLTEGGHETALLIESEGVMGFKIQGQSRRIKPRVRLFDPTTARLVEEIAPSVEEVQFFTASVQGGLLVVTTSTGRVFAYAPR